MEKVNRGIPVIDDRPMTPERLEAMHRKWQLRVDDTMPWEDDSFSETSTLKTRRRADVPLMAV